MMSAKLRVASLAMNPICSESFSFIRIKPFCWLKYGRLGMNRKKYLKAFLLVTLNFLLINNGCVSLPKSNTTEKKAANLNLNYKSNLSIIFLVVKAGIVQEDVEPYQKIIEKVLTEYKFFKSFSLGSIYSFQEPKKNSNSDANFAIKLTFFEREEDPSFLNYSNAFLSAMTFGILPTYVPYNITLEVRLHDLRENQSGYYHYSCSESYYKPFMVNTEGAMAWSDKPPSSSIKNLLKCALFNLVNSSQIKEFNILKNST
jgi:hypothetical protein